RRAVAPPPTARAIGRDGRAAGRRAGSSYRASGRVRLTARVGWTKARDRAGRLQTIDRAFAHAAPLPVLRPARVGKIAQRRYACSTGIERDFAHPPAPTLESRRD